MGGKNTDSATPRVRGLLLGPLYPVAGPQRPGVYLQGDNEGGGGTRTCTVLGVSEEV